MNFVRKLFASAFNYGMTVNFHMRGGHVITARHVSKIVMTTDNPTGSYSGYSIIWIDGCKPNMFSLSIPDIVAVTTV